MEKYIYTSRGNPVGYIQGRFIYSMSGHAVGQIKGTHVYKLSGRYFAELDRQMVVRKPLVYQANIGSLMGPGIIGRPAVPANRAPVSYGYQDVSKELFS